jgi:endonuclease YncB( thermonuclease family)
MIKHKAQLLLLALTLTFSIATLADTIEGRVVGVSDGDTLTVLDAGNTQFKIRLAAIDAPEKKMPFGQRSKEKLSDICYGKQASVIVVDTDRYGRTVGEITCEGLNANELMIQSGLAWVYRKYAKGYGQLYALEDEAKTAKRGLWVDPNPTAPWDWRKAKRAKE